MSGSPGLRCSFCGGHHTQRRHMVKGCTSALICNECVEDAAGAVALAKRSPDGDLAACLRLPEAAR